MGGFGSGCYRWQTKTSIESQLAVDIRYIKKQGLLTQGQKGVLSWSCNGKTTGKINYQVHESGINLSYKTGSSKTSEWKEIELFIHFAYTPCNYGGERTWLICPNTLCNRRVTCLYGTGEYFLCRHCNNLNYQSQHQNYRDRQLTKAQEIRQQLGGSKSLFQSFPDKPKGMHWKTYQKLYQQAQQAEQNFLNA